MAVLRDQLMRTEAALVDAEDARQSESQSAKAHLEASEEKRLHGEEQIRALQSEIVAVTTRMQGEMDAALASAEAERNRFEASLKDINGRLQASDELRKQLESSIKLETAQ